MQLPGTTSKTCAKFNTHRFSPIRSDVKVPCIVELDQTPKSKIAHFSHNSEQNLLYIQSVWGFFQ